MTSELWARYFALWLLPLAVSVVSPLPFAYLVPALALGGLILFRVKEKAWPQFDFRLYGWVSAICALMGLSTLWSVDPDRSLQQAFKLGTMLLCSLPLLDLARAAPQAAITPLQRWLPLAGIAIAAAAATELALDFPVYRAASGAAPDEMIFGSILNKNAAVAVMILPFALLFCRRTKSIAAAALLLAAMAALFVFTESQSAQLAIIIMLFAWLALFVLPDAGIPVAFGKVALVLLLMPWLAPIAFDAFAASLAKSAEFASKASTSARLENWDFISRKVIEKPWLGFGMDATRSIEDFRSEKLYFPSDRVMHPHNLALQVWIEFGLPGIVVALGFFTFLFRRLMALPHAQRRIPFAAFCGAMVFLMLSWSLWSGWLLALLIYVAALIILAARPTPAPETSSPPQ